MFRGFGRIKTSEAILGSSRPLDQRLAPTSKSDLTEREKAERVRSEMRSKNVAA